MRGHTLMQTIARANRVYGDKVNGLIVDYANVFQELEKALAIYGSGTGGGVVDLPQRRKGRGGSQRWIFQIDLFFASLCGLCALAVNSWFEDLDSGLPEKYTTELFEQKCGVLFQHVLVKYPDQGASVYSEAG